MKEHHVVVSVEDCKDSTVNDTTLIEEFLGVLMDIFRTDALHGPTALRRKGIHEGVTGVLVTHHSHIIMHTFPKTKEAVVEMYSCEMVDVTKIRDTFLKHFNEGIANMKVCEFTGNCYEFIECEETNCSRKAAKDWKGRKVCHDHYDKWQEVEYESFKDSSES